MKTTAKQRRNVVICAGENTIYADLVSDIEEQAERIREFEARKEDYLRDWQTVMGVKENALYSRIEELQAIVDTLPKTADGVTIRLRMTVWTLEDGKPWEWTVAIMGLNVHGEPYLWLDDGEPDRMVSEPAHCYSTREAAEAKEKS